jgi:hypothetical protein
LLPDFGSRQPSRREAHEARGGDPQFTAEGYLSGRRNVQKLLIESE